MNKKTDSFSLYEERGDLLERKAISQKYNTGWYLQAQLDEINEQIRVIENVTPQAQGYYFETIPAWQVEAEAQSAEDRDDKATNQSALDRPVFGSATWFAGIDEIPF